MSFSQDIFSVSPVAEPRKVFLKPFDSRQDTENVLDCSPSMADLLLKSCFQYDFFFFFISCYSRGTHFALGYAYVFCQIDTKLDSNSPFLGE